MAALGSNDMVAGAVPKQNRLAQAGTSREQGAGGAGYSFTRIQNAKIFRRKMAKTVSGSAKVIEQHNRLNLKFAGQKISVDHPGKIGRVDPVINYRTGHAKSGCPDFRIAEMWSGLAGELFYDKLKPGEVFTGKTLAKDDFELVLFQIGRAHV